MRALDVIAFPIDRTALCARSPLSPDRLSPALSPHFNPPRALDGPLL